PISFQPNRRGYQAPPGKPSCHGGNNNNAKRQRRQCQPMPRAIVSGGRRTNFVNPCIKYALFFFNFVFWLAGSLILGIGVAAAFMKREAFDSASGGVKDIFSVIFDATLVFIAFGALVFLLTFAGCLGSLRDNACLLKFFALSLFVIFLAECAAAIAVFVLKDRAIDYVETVLKANMITMYREERYEDTQNFIDWYHKNLACCGAASYRDWNDNKYFACNANNTSPERCGVPFSCCKKMNDIDDRVINTMCGYHVTNPRNTEQPEARIWTVGCVEATRKYIENNVIPVAGVAIAVSVVQLTAIFLSRVLAGQIQDQVTLLRRTGELV
uniref:Tetraspanin-33 n=2 Tax=Macrostomum lignano TaxID=282301 RepID=A0A1I8H4M1_9PLAT